MTSSSLFPAAVWLSISSSLSLADKISLICTNKQVRQILFPSLLSRPNILSIESLTAFTKFLNGMRITTAPKLDVISLQQAQQDPRALAIEHFDCSKLSHHPFYGECINPKFISILLEVCPNIKSLNLIGGQIDRGTLLMIGVYCPKLTLLNLSRCTQLEKYEDELPRLKNLESLGLSETKVLLPNLYSVFKKMPKLKLVDISRSTFSIDTRSYRPIQGQKLLFPQEIIKKQAKDFYVLIDQNYY